MRKEPLVTGEYYHIYNRGVEKREIFSDVYDLERFLLCMEEFNTEKPIGGLHMKSPEKDQLSGPTTKLVVFVAYCLNPNHYHFLLRQNIEGGISEFIKRLSGGYTRYFNEKKGRSGVLFQGKFKSKHVFSNTYLLHVSAYVNLNDRVHRYNSASTGSRSSWNEYVDSASKNICERDVILSQFKNSNDYKKFAHASLKDMIKRKDNLRDMVIEERDVR